MANFYREYCCDTLYGITNVYDVHFCLLSGDILIFMPGQEDIEVTCELIAGMFISRASQSVSKNISMAQLSRMSHCAPEATLKPICFHF